PGKSLPIVLKKGEDGRYPSLWGHPLNTGKGFYTNSPSEHPSASGVPAGHLVLRNFLSVPAKVGGRVVGQIGIANSARDYTDEDVSAVGRLADVYSMAIMRWQGEEMLAASREEYRILVENMPCMVFRGKTTMFDELHGPVEAITGRTREDLLQGRPKWREVIHPDDLEMYDEWRELVVAHRTPAKFEYRIMHKDGSVRWVSSSVNILVDADGAPTAYGTISDITEDKRRDEVIRYQAVLMSNVRDPVLATDIGLGITYMNSAAEEFYGFSLDEIRGRNIHESLRTEFLDASHEEVARNVVESGHHRGRCFQYDKEGNRLSLEFSISSLEDGKGRVTGFVGSGQDISLSLSRDRELTKAKEYAESLVDNTNAMFVVLDKDGIISLFNRTAEEVTGRPRSEVIGSDWFEDFISAALRDEVRREFDMIVAGQRPGLTEFENAIVTRDGKERVVVWRNSLLMVGGEVEGVVSFGIDVTDLRRSEERFRLFAKNAKDVVLSIVLDPTPRIEYISPSVMTVAGRPPEDFYNIPGLVFDIIHP
ncbi:MAG: PAS domain S-box protein, partial [Thermoplasmata archaeon]|nr:PAS domain S-box protein [Thermoplasmata archaeon]